MVKTTHLQDRLATASRRVREACEKAGCLPDLAVIMWLDRQLYEFRTAHNAIPLLEAHARHEVSSFSTRARIYAAVAVRELRGQEDNVFWTTWEKR